MSATRGDKEIVVELVRAGAILDLQNEVCIIHSNNYTSRLTMTICGRRQSCFNSTENLA